MILIITQLEKKRNIWRNKFTKKIKSRWALLL